MDAAPPVAVAHVWSLEVVVAEDRSGFGPFEDLVGRLIGELGSSLSGGPRPTGTTSGSAATPQLDRYGRDLTEAARQGLLDPVIGRDAEVGQLLEVLARRTKNNPVLVGDAGVGKTAIVEGLAQRIADGNVPASLKGVRVVELGLAGLVAGTRYRGDFEERITKVIDEVVAADRSVIVFVDELHAVVGAGAAEGAPMDAGSILKPALARGTLQLIGATTVEEYRRHIAKDAALERRFEPVVVAEPSVEQTIVMLHGLKERYEQHHDVRIDDAALEAAARLSKRVVSERRLPDKAIDLIDRASSRARIRAGDSPDRAAEYRLAERADALRASIEKAVAAEEFERAARLTGELDGLDASRAVPGVGSQDAVRITAEDVALVVADTTGVPVAQLTATDRQRLLELEAVLHRRVVGQDQAVQAVSDAVRAGRAGLADPDRPVGSFLFMGPTGVGKTELARALAEALFGTTDALIRFDMSEYADRSSTMRLVGAPPGHVGYDDAGQLTEALRRTPYAVLLLDEIEKAHPEVIGTLLQVLDAGRLTDAHGRTVDVTNAVVIMTSNLGADVLLAAARTGQDAEEVREPLTRQLRAHFRPEFLNRIDEVVVFHALDRGELHQITGLLLTRTTARLAAQGIALEVTPAVLDWIVERGHRPEYGARHLRRTIAAELERRLSRLIISEDLGRGHTVSADVVDGGLTLTTT